MTSKSVFTLMFVSLLFGDAVAQEKMFRDDFSTDHNFLVDGVATTGWDGFIGKGATETADRIATHNGKLFLQSTRGRYQEGWNPLGPLLFKTVTGDFKATVRIEDYQSLSFNNAGIMARVANADDAGKGEDWISVDYFPIYGGIYARMADDNRRTEKGSNGQGRNADKYLQLELIGNLFFLRYSPDGVSWTELPSSPIRRNDLVNVPLQVGLFQATYSENQGEVSFDNFSLELGDEVKTARIQTPANDATNQPKRLTFSWIPGSGVEHHDVFFGSSEKEVADADRDSDTYLGRRDADDIEFTRDDLAGGKSYFWRVDEVGASGTHRGDVWKFTVYDRHLADLEKYPTEAELAADWKISGGKIALSKSKAGRPVMKAVASGSGACRVERTFSNTQDWLSSTYGFRSIKVVFGDARPTSENRLRLRLEDNQWGQRVAEVAYLSGGSSGEDWVIDLRDLLKSNAAIRLDHVQKIGFEFDGPGTVDIESVSIEYSNREGAGPKYVRPELFVSPVGFENVRVTAGLWRERMDVNRRVSLPHVWGRCESSIKGNGDISKRLDNFRKVAGEMDGEFTGTFFNDSDVYKIIEGTANSLRNHPDPELESYTDKVIDSIAKAQWEDGYLFTFYSLPERKPASRWSNIGSMHELYCAGHLIEAGIAYYEATEKRKLLDVAIRFADLIADTFVDGKRVDPPGHQEIELALIKLARVTGNDKYLDTAKYFVDQRGRPPTRRLYGTYSQDHLPFVEQEKGVGHSVRAGYLYCAATDLAMLRRDEHYANSLHRIWDNVVNSKTYLTGGIGQPGGPEGFAGDYELGNSCYAETCSGIAFAMWNHRLHQMTGESKYSDLIERTFFNNMLSALSFEGDKHYYTNPLMTNGRERWPWPGHDCACCPSNLVRVISSIGGYAYSRTESSIQVNQYLDSTARIPVSGTVVSLKQKTNYPWDGDIDIEVTPDSPALFEVRLRVPGWARDQPMPGNLYQYVGQQTEAVTVTVNGQSIEIDPTAGYVDLKRQWKSGDRIQLKLPMRVRRVVANPRVTADKGLVAVERGPIVFCAEFKDNPGLSLPELKLSDDAKLRPRFDDDLFGGVVTLVDEGSGLKLIPYYVYSNRGPGWMRVWMQRD